MNTQIISNSKHISTRLSVVLLAVLVFLSACERQPQLARVEEITFQSGEFALVGDLLLPEGDGPFPVILFLEGSGPVDRYGWMSMPELVLQAGYATFIWDAPGLGESTGHYNEAQIIEQRAGILLAAIDAVKEHPEIDPQRIGLLGESQGGYVMSRALAKIDEIAFMICISCPGMAGNDQTAYQLARMAFCDDPAAEAEPQVAALLTELRSAAQYETYEGYQRYWEILNKLGDVASANLEGHRPASQETWEANPLASQTYWNPIRVIEQTSIPVLSIVSERDRNIDPFQAAYAWEQALVRNGNPHSRLTVLPGIDHSMFPSQTGCPAEMGQLLDEYSRSKGFGSFEELYQERGENPYQPGAYADFPWASESLNLIVDWLKNLQP
jgi:hypothetical protein